MKKALFLVVFGAWIGVVFAVLRPRSAEAGPPSNCPKGSGFQQLSGQYFDLSGGAGTAGICSPDGVNVVLFQTFDGGTVNGVPIAQVQHGRCVDVSGVCDGGFAYAFSATPDCTCSPLVKDGGEAVTACAATAAGAFNIGSNATTGSTSTFEIICAN
jgi:hypothetical protein